MSSTYDRFPVTALLCLANGPVLNARGTLQVLRMKDGGQRFIISTEESESTDRMRRSQEESATTNKPPDDVKPPSWLDLQRVISLEEAAKIRGISKDTLKREAERGTGPPIVRLSKRRVGMRLVDALGK